MRNGVMLINTSRGGLVSTKTVIDGLKSGKFSAVGLDVYEEEGDIFFEDHSHHVMTDDMLARLLTFPNVLVTGHQVFVDQKSEVPPSYRVCRLSSLQLHSSRSLR
jgi:D-lactate dehydrogenase